jgi:TonB family protein
MKTPVALLIPLALAAAFEPARLERRSIASIPYGTAAAGVASIDVGVDERGRVTDVKVVQDLAPFTDVLRQSAKGWTFRAARENGRAVATRVLVAGLFRPAMLLFPAPNALPSPPPDAESAIPLPTSVEVPPYPPNAVGSVGVLVEVTVSESGGVSGVRIVGETSGFDDAALSAARSWSFRPASRGGSRVEAQAYLLFVFRQPV